MMDNQIMKNWVMGVILAAAAIAMYLGFFAKMAPSGG
jgi:hypothetical protein